MHEKPESSSPDENNKALDATEETKNQDYPSAITNNAGNRDALDETTLGTDASGLHSISTPDPTADQLYIDKYTGQLEGVDRSLLDPDFKSDSQNMPCTEEVIQDDETFSPLRLRDRVTIMLLFREYVKTEQVERAWHEWKRACRRGATDPLWRYLARDPDVNREVVYAEAADVYAFKKVSITLDHAISFLKEHRESFTDEKWERLKYLKILPVAREGNSGAKEAKWVFITHDPTRPEVHRILRDLNIRQFEIRYAPESLVNSLIFGAFPRKNEFLERMRSNQVAYNLGTAFEESTNEIDEEALEVEISRSSLINLFEAALVEAVREGASDIHIIPNQKRQVEILFRVDGGLKLWHTEENVHPEAFQAVVKNNAPGVDRFERDMAQDGYLQRWVDEVLIRFRVSVIPIATGCQDFRAESIVIRVLDDRKVISDIGNLGFREEARRRFEWAITEPYGMVILTGPTGSGKTTTLYAALRNVVTPKVNVLTVEDPVEYIIPGVRQVKLSHKFRVEDALRAILRHDPDIVMVGEIRDRETAELAIKLSNTGHLTFSTLHTNDAPSAINRLYKMGIEPFLIAYTVNLIVAQRLVRKLCPTCKVIDDNLDPQLLKRAGFDPDRKPEERIYKAGNWPQCPTCKGAGYKGRTAVTEAMVLSDEIRREILSAKDIVDEGVIRKIAIEQGMFTLLDSAREVAKSGDTSLSEMLRTVSTRY